jgi:hypothetical protein
LLLLLLSLLLLKKQVGWNGGRNFFHEKHMMHCQLLLGYINRQTGPDYESYSIPKPLPPLSAFL